MAEQAFKSQAEDLVGGGALNAETRAQLDALAKQMGLGEDSAQRIVRGIANRRLAGNLSSMKAQGLLTLGKVLELRSQDVDVGSVLSESDLTALFRAEVESLVSGGEGAIDAHRVLVALPQELGIDVAKAARIGRETAKSKARNILVQV